MRSERKKERKKEFISTTLLSSYYKRRLFVFKSKNKNYCHYCRQQILDELLRHSLLTSKSKTIESNQKMYSFIIMSSLFI